MIKKILLFICLLNSITLKSFAENVYVDINFENSNRIFRIKTDDESTRPIGWIYSNEHQTYGYFIDFINNHRFVILEDNLKKEFNQCSGNIYRQVFDGIAQDSDKGRMGTSTSYDSRDELIAGEKGKAVYRPISAPFSADVGTKVEESLALENLEKNECEIIKSKSWYSIPNGSWYQCCSPIVNGSNLSYDIIYDRWEEKENLYLEELWRGDSLCKAFERKIGFIPIKRLQRAKVDGALEKIEDGELKTVLEQTYKSSFYMLPGNYNKENKIGCYYWNSDKKGEFYISGYKVNVEPIYESKEKDNRFVCYGTAITGLRKYYILGNDILKQWLSKYNMPIEKAECTNIAFISLDKSLKTMIYIYSKPENCLYRFIISEETDIEIGLPKKINLNFNVASMILNEQGDLYIAEEVIKKTVPTLDNFEDIEMEVNDVLEKTNDSVLEEQKPEDNKNVNYESDEAFKLRQQIRNLTKCNAVCNVILSRAYYQNFYELPFGKEQTKKLDYSIFLGKEFFSCKFSFNNISLSKLDSGLNTLLEELKKPGNNAGEIESKVPGYDNTFIKPLRYYLAIH